MIQIELREIVYYSRVKGFSFIGKLAYYFATNYCLSYFGNLGIKNAKGEHIALLDTDEVWFSHKLEQQVAILDSCAEANMVYGLLQYWYSRTEIPESG